MSEILRFIWLAALGLSVLAIGALAALVAARLHRARLETAHLALRARTSQELVRYAMAGGDRPKLPRFRPFERWVLVEAGLDAALLMQGPAQERLVAFFRAIGLDKRLRRQARRGHLRGRLAAVEALRLFADPETVTVLQKILRSREMRIWVTALRSLTDLGAAPDILDLLRLIERPGAGKSHVVYQVIAERTRANLSEALSALFSPQTGEARALLARAIGETGDPEALAPLQAALLNPDMEVRAAAARALGDLGLAEAAESLAFATTDPDWRVRLRACEAIGRLGAWRHALSLQPLIDDPVWWVRFRAEEALRRLAELGEAEVSEAADPPSRAARKVPQAAKRARA